MKVLKHSKQRDAIKEFLMSRSDHPTADTIYENIRLKYPNISLGTVYRNLNLLVELNEAVKITSKEGSDRFDGRTIPHYHFICNKCNKINDLIMSPINEIEVKAQNHTEDSIDSHEINFYGVCKQCMEKAENMK